MIPLLISIFLVLLFIVTIALSARTWRGAHITLMCLTFLATILLVVCASLSVKTRTYWRKRHADVQKQLEDAKLEGQRLSYGDPQEVRSAEPSVFDVKQRLHRMLLDRGRVWRQCSPGRPTGNQILVSTVPPNTPEGTEIPPNGISANSVLYAFRDAKLSETMSVPSVYLGEYKVVKADAKSATLQPTLPLDGAQQRLVADQSATWTLYEMMPLDAHRVFSDQDTVDKPLDDTSKPVFGEMNEQALRLAFSAASGLPVEDPRINTLVADYLKDGIPASEQDQNQRPESMWLKLEFEKAHKVQVDTKDSEPGMDGGYFDPKGLAKVPRLQRGGEAEFRENDIGIFSYGYELDKEYVDGLISGGVCRNIGPIYVRELHDYEDAFHTIQDEFFKRQEDIARANRDIAHLNTAISRTQEETAYRQDERSKLQTDQEKFLLEKEKITALAASLDSMKKTLRGELSQLFRMNLALSEQLTEIDAKVTEEINRRTSEVAALQSP